MNVSPPFVAEAGVSVDSELGQFVSRNLGTPVVSLRRHLISGGSYASQILSAQLVTGPETTLFLKDFGAVRIWKADIEGRRDREIGVYRDLLSRMELGTARYYGSVCDDARGRSWLLLEFVTGRELRSNGSAGYEAAAIWLARMQADVRGHGLLDEAGFLPRHDARFFHREAERAARVVAGVSPRLAARLEAAVSNYDAAVQVMVGQPETLVHGSYTDILVHRAGSGLRICPIDWEHSAIGAPLHDLAYLAEGLADDRIDRLLRAYRRHAAELGVAETDFPETSYVFRCFQLHRALGLVRKAVKRSKRQERVRPAVRRVEQLARSVGASPR